MGIIVIIILIIFFIGFRASNWIELFIRGGKQSQLRRYTRLTLGMSEDELISIMKKGYAINRLSNGDVVYIWSYRATGGRTATRAFSGQSYISSEERSVIVTVRNGEIIEIRTNNVR